MKIFKPDSLGLLHRGMRFARKNQLSIGMMAFFPLDETPGAALLPEAQMWKAAAEAVGADAIMDEGLPKPAGEFLVFGAAYAPSGVAAPEVAVRAQVGSLSKTLRVSGDRHFNALGVISGPKPFTQMAISPQTAFGGPDSADNPAGKGLVKLKNADGSEGLPLPNVEHMAKLVLRPGDEAPAAGFWSLPPDSPLRKRHLGTFNDAWLKTSWPHLPDDTQPAYFNVAPADQRLGGFFRGDEKIVVHNMHPQRALISSALPQLRARCFINRRVAGGEEFVEVTARAETVWLFPGQGCGIVLFRALATVADEDADDVLHLLADWEDLRSAPLPLDHYYRAFQAQLPQAPVAPAVLPPVVAPAVPAAAAAAMPAAAAALTVPAVAVAMPPELAAVQKQAAELEGHTRELMRQHGITDADIAPYLKPPVDGPAPTLAELEKMSQDLEADTRALMKQHNISEAEVAAAVRQPPPEPAPSAAELKDMVKKIEADTRESMRQHGITEQDIQKEFDSRPELAGLAADFRKPGPDIDQAFAALGVAMAAQAAPPPALKLPALPLPTLPAAKPPVAQKLTREEVVARHAAGKGFASYDLSGVDLSALDLAGADFSGALLEGTGFAGSKLAAANFSQALLQGGDFSEADLKGAKFGGASAGQAVFKQARLDGSDMSHADFTGADFSAASVAGAKLSDAVFDGAKMAGLKAAGCTALRTSFAGGDLAGADFARAVLTGAAFAGAKVGKASFAGANGDNADFQQADASGANFTGASLRASRADRGSQFAGAQLPGAQLERAAWGGAMLAGAALGGAVLDNADFSDIKAAGANFGRTSAKGTRFDKADLSGADLTGVNLHKGSLRKANTERTLLRKANLYGVDFYDTTPTIASLEGSNIDQTILVIRKPVV